MSPLDWIASVLLVSGGLFFLTGTVGLLRFPDIYTRLHAITKADNLGLGLIILSLIVQSRSWTVTLQLALTWAVVMFASATACHLVARSAMQMEIPPWKGDERNRVVV